MSWGKISLKNRFYQVLAYFPFAFWLLTTHLFNRFYILGFLYGILLFALSTLVAFPSKHSAIAVVLLFLGMKALVYQDMVTMVHGINTPLEDIYVFVLALIVYMNRSDLSFIQRLPLYVEATFKLILIISVFLIINSFEGNLENHMRSYVDYDIEITWLLVFLKAAISTYIIRFDFTRALSLSTVRTNDHQE